MEIIMKFVCGLCRAEFIEGDVEFERILDVLEEGEGVDFEVGTPYLLEAGKEILARLNCANCQQAGGLRLTSDDDKDLVPV